LLRKGPSPVKAQTALFEKTQFHVPGAYIHERPNREDAITTSTVRSIRKKLEREESTSRLVHTPPIELGLPQLISYPHRDSQRSSESDYSGTRRYDPAQQTTAMSCPTAQSKQHRKVSIPWPFKWNLFP
jgi:hypothetical protein